MLNNCLNHLINKLQDFDIQSCLIRMDYDEYYGELKVYIDNINNVELYLEDFDDKDHYFESRISDEGLQTKLMQDNIKIDDMIKLFYVIEEFKYYYSTGINKLPTPKASWWQSFKYKNFATPYYKTNLTYKYLRT